MSAASSLDVVSNIRVVEEALLDVLSLAFQKREAEQPDLATLRTAFTPQLLKDRALVYVAAEDRVYRWDRYSTLPDDGLEVIAPTPATTPDAGRWLRVTSSVFFGPNSNLPLQSRRQGYCKTVLLYRGDESDEQMQEAIYGQKPAMLLEWLSDDPQPWSLFAGALYKDAHQFNLFIVSECLRGTPAGPWGSALAAEAATDPGINEMVGQVRKVLAGVPLGIRNLEHVEIGPARKVEERLAERLFIYSISFFVRTNFYIPDEDLEPLALQASPRLADQGPAEADFDPLNYVAQGYLVPPGPGLSRTYGVGIAFIGGAAVSSTPPPVTFAASSDIYRDLKPDGTLTYLTVARGAPPPPVPAGALRIGRTRTGGTAIESDQWLCSSSLALGSFFKVL